MADENVAQPKACNSRSFPLILVVTKPAKSLGNVTLCRLSKGNFISNGVKYHAEYGLSITAIMFSNRVSLSVLRDATPTSVTRTNATDMTKVARSLTGRVAKVARELNRDELVVIVEDEARQAVEQPARKVLG